MTMFPSPPAAGENERQIIDALGRIEHLLERLEASEDRGTAAIEKFRADFDAFVSEWQGNTPPPRQAVTGRLSIQGAGDTMSLTVRTVDDVDEAVFQFTDDHGDIASAPVGDGSGLTVTFASDNEATASFANPVAVAGTDANGNPEYVAPITYGVDGSWNESAVVANVSGATLLDDDGITDFVQPQPEAQSVVAGQAVTGEADVEAAPPSA